MFTGLSSSAKAFVFYAITLALALLVVGAAGWIGEISPLFTMFTPAIAVIIMLTLVAREGGFRAALASLGLDRPGWSAWAIAIIGPILLLFMVYAVVWMTDIASFKSPDLSSGVLKVFVNLSSGLLVGTVWALCEEVGWRGYMLPKLLGLGTLTAMLLVGFLHGVWHLPLMLTTPYYHADGNPLIVVPLFLVTLTLAGIAFGYVRLISGSVWPAAILHGVFNWTWELMNELTEVHSPEWFEYTGGESGMLTIAGLAVLAAVLLWRMQELGLTSSAAPRI